MTNQEILDGILLREHLVFLAKYNTENLFAKDLEGHKAELEELPTSELIEYIEGFKKVDESFEDGGRWSNYVTRVYETYFEKEYRYIRVVKEVPATEQQDGGDFDEPEISIVERKKVETYVYE